MGRKYPPVKFRDLVGFRARAASGRVAYSAGGYWPTAALLSSPSLRPFRRLRHHGHAASAATPTTPAAVPARPRFSAVVVEYSATRSWTEGPHGEFGVADKRHATVDV